MSNYHLSAKPISRAKGRSATAAAAYRAGVSLFDDRTGLEFDYSRRYGVMHTQIFAPENAPAWAMDREKLWNAVELSELRKDSQVAREIELALPHELNQPQRERLVAGFVRQQFVQRGMIADVAFHAPDQGGDQRNFHAHIMLTMRTVDADGFGQKERSWNGKAMLQQWREQWAEHCNTALEAAGFDERVDHRSYKDQGVNQLPTVHLGWKASEMERNGFITELGDINRAIEADNRQIKQLENELLELSKQREQAQPIEVANERRQSDNVGEQGAYAVRASDHSGGIQEHFESLCAVQAQQNNALLRATFARHYADWAAQTNRVQSCISDNYGLRSTTHENDRKPSRSLRDLRAAARLAITEALENARAKIAGLTQSAIERLRAAGAGFQRGFDDISRACKQAGRGSRELAGAGQLAKQNHCELAAGVDLLESCERVALRAHRAAGSTNKQLEFASRRLDEQLEPTAQQCEPLDRAARQFLARLDARISLNEQNKDTHNELDKHKKQRYPGL